MLADPEMKDFAAEEIEAAQAQIEALDNVVPADLQVELMVELRTLVERAVRWLLRNRKGHAGVAEAVAYRIVDFSAGVVFGVRGSIERVTPRVFLLSPAQVNIKVEEPQAPSSAHDLFAD